MSAVEGVHQPAEDSSLEANLKFAVGHSLELLWEALKPKLRVRRVPLNIPGIEAAYSKFATVAAVKAEGAARGCQRRASWCRRPPHGLVLGQANGSHEQDAER